MLSICEDQDERYDGYKQNDFHSIEGAQNGLNIY